MNTLPSILHCSMANVEETILVTGGCGFVGHHILKTLRAQRPRWSLHSISRIPNRNLVDGVTYHAGSISSHEDVQSAFQRARFTVLVHTASPAAVGRSRADDRTYYVTNVAGTQCLLDCARAAGSVKAFVFTSSAMTIEGLPLHMASEEDTCMVSRTSRCDHYSKSKALAETLVLNANGTAGMLTASLRLPSAYGDRDEQYIGGAIEALRRGEHKVQIGDNTNLNDCVSGENAASAHYLAIKALLEEEKLEWRRQSVEKVNGEAFFITDGEPLPFWDHFRIIWRAAGDRTSEKEVWRILPWLAMSLAAVVEAAYWVFTLGTKRPEVMRRDLLQITFLERTFSIDKARRRLGYEPVHDTNTPMCEGVRWYLGQHPLAS